MIRENGQTGRSTLDGRRGLVEIPGNSRRKIYCEIKGQQEYILTWRWARLASPQGSPACLGSSTADRPAPVGSFVRSFPARGMRCRNKWDGWMVRDICAGTDATATAYKLANEPVRGLVFLFHGRDGRRIRDIVSWGQARDSAEGYGLGRLRRWLAGDGVWLGEGEMLAWWGRSAASCGGGWLYISQGLAAVGFTPPRQTRPRPSCIPLTFRFLRRLFRSRTIVLCPPGLKAAVGAWCRVS